MRSGTWMATGNECCRIIIAVRKELMIETGGLVEVDGTTNHNEWCRCK